MTRPPRRVSKGRRSTTRDRASLSSSAAVKSYKIGEAAHLVGVKPYVLRFWESEFPILRPAHTQSKHRVYLDKDIEMLRLVRKLLHEERFTIEGAKRVFDADPQQLEAPSPAARFAGSSANL